MNVTSPTYHSQRHLYEYLLQRFNPNASNPRTHVAATLISEHNFQNITVNNIRPGAQTPWQSKDSGLLP
jgi:hypothetical protein